MNEDSDIVIRAQGLGKRYRLGPAAHGPFAYGSLRDTLSRGVHGLWRTLASRRAEAEKRWLWALKDVAFEVRRGEVLGIIGRNGAGKSTLLKILSRITEPTEGWVDLEGRVGSLLEVGTGFHPELSGRENIFLNGAILGMKRREIRARFDAIVEFAELAKFIDTPVKYYSSGMYMRLAFSVAAHLEPEILLVDEVLAVGDAQFQKKCLGKMGEVAHQGRTVLFVSHNMSAVTSLCQSALWLDRGQVRRSGKVGEVIGEYIDSQSVAAQGDIEGRLDRRGSGEVRFTSIATRREGAAGSGSPTSGAPAVIEIGLHNRSAQDLPDLRINITVDDYLTQRVTAFSNRLTNCRVGLAAGQRGRLTVFIERMPLIPGRYHVNLLCEHNGALCDLIYQAGVFDVGPGQFFRDQVIDEASCGFGVCMIAHRMVYSGSCGEEGSGKSVE